MGGIESVSISKTFRELYTATTRYFFLTGGRGSLKSTTVHDFIARLTYEVGHGVLFTRYTMVSAEKSIIPEFLLAIDRLGIRDDFYVTKNIIRNKHTKSFILFSGIKVSGKDQTANLKSIAGITTWVIDEGEDFHDEKAFDAIDDSIRTSSLHNRVIWIQNPTTRDHFIYKRWIENSSHQAQYQGYNVTLSSDPNVTHIHSTYHAAEKLGYLSQGWIDKANRYRIDAEKSKDKHKSWYYYNYIGGWLEKAEGVIFENWHEGAFDITLPSLYGLDPGFYPDPLALIKTAVDKRKKLIYWKEMIYETELSTENVVLMIGESGIKKHELIVADTNEPRLTNAIRNAGYNIVKALKGPVVDDIREMKNYTMVIDPGSNNVKKELNKYTWNDKKASIPIDAWNHSIDAGRYGFRRLVPAVRQVGMTGISYRDL